MKNISSNKLFFQGLFQDSFPKNQFSRTLSQKISFPGRFSKKSVFQDAFPKNQFSRTLFQKISFPGLFSKKSVFQDAFPKNQFSRTLFQKISFPGRFSKTLFQKISFPGRFSKKSVFQDAFPGLKSIPGVSRTNGHPSNRSLWTSICRLQSEGNPLQCKLTGF